MIHFLVIVMDEFQEIAYCSACGWIQDFAGYTHRDERNEAITGAYRGHVDAAKWEGTL